MISTNSNKNSTATSIVDYYYATRTKESPSPTLMFPSASPTPKLASNTAKKPASPFDWAKECLLDGGQTTPSWDYHFDEMERIGRELEQDTMALEKLREKANPTPEERFVLNWIHSPSPPLLTNQSHEQIVPDSTAATSASFIKPPQEQQPKTGTGFLTFLNRFKTSFKLHA